MAQDYKSVVLTPPEEENQVSLMSSIGAGIATGLIKLTWVSSSGGVRTTDL